MARRVEIIRTLLFCVVPLSQFYIFAMSGYESAFERFIVSTDLKCGPSPLDLERWERAFPRYFPIISTKYGSGLLRIFALGSTQFCQTPTRLVWNLNPVAISACGRYLAESINASVLSVWDTVELCDFGWSRIGALPGDPNYKISSLAFSSGQGCVFLATGSIDGRIKLVDIKDLASLTSVADRNEKIFEFDLRHGNAIKSIQFSPKNRYIIANCGTSVDIFDVREKVLVQSFSMCGVLIKAFDCMPNEKFISLVDSDDVVSLWEIKTKLCFLSYQECVDSEITCIKFSPDGELMAVGFRNGMIAFRYFGPTEFRMCTVSDCVRCRACTISTFFYKLHEDAIRAMNFSSDGKCIITGADDCTVKIYHIPTRKCVGMFFYPFRRSGAILNENYVRFVCFVPGNGQIRLFDSYAESCDRTIFLPAQFSFWEQILIIKLQQTEQCVGYFDRINKRFELDPFWRRVFDALPRDITEYFTKLYKSL